VHNEIEMTAPKLAPLMNPATGPRTEEGKKKSSLNATKHGFTGQTLILSPEETAAYQAHLANYLQDFKPATHEETEFLHQYADLRWSLHQISVQQQNLLSIVSAITKQIIETGDPLDLGPALDPHYKTLKNLSLYEQRRRRASEDTLNHLRDLQSTRVATLVHDIDLAAPIYAMFKDQGKPFDPAAMGFVCSTFEIENYLNNRQIAKDVEKFNAGQKR
jgi:hypothetical protein